MTTTSTMYGTMSLRVARGSVCLATIVSSSFFSSAGSWFSSFATALQWPEMSSIRANSPPRTVMRLSSTLQPLSRIALDNCLTIPDWSLPRAEMTRNFFMVCRALRAGIRRIGSGVSYLKRGAPAASGYADCAVCFSAYLRQPLHRLGHRRLGVAVVLELAAEVLVVGGHVEVAVAGEVEEDRFLLAALFARERLVDRHADGVVRLGRRQDALGARELHARLEGRKLRHRDRLDETLVIELRHKRRVTVVAQAAGVNARGHEIVPQGVHLQERRESHGVAEVVGVFAFRERRARGRLDRHQPQLPARGLVGEERERDAAEVRAAAA